MKAKLDMPIVVFAFLAVLVSFHLFSRFTVDDAFITWRYGKNLVDYGVWGYNPTDFDLTQAYTNPIYALASIIPAAAGWDMVLFFKILSVLTIVGFLAGFCWLARNKTLALTLGLLFVALPASMIHAFSGLETFVYVSVLGFLLIAIARDNLRAATIFAALLVLTRPEAWLLVALVPAYFFGTRLLSVRERGTEFNATTVRSAVLPAVYSQVFLGLLFGAYAVFHYVHFGDVLPNTFYVKSKAPFNLLHCLYFSFLLTPLLVFVSAGRPRVALFALLFFLPVIYTYSTSPLQMNYMERFAYHFFGPVYIVIAWVAAGGMQQTDKGDGREGLIGQAGRASGGTSLPISSVSIAFLAVFMLFSAKPESLFHLTNYYVRTLAANAELGRSLAELRTDGVVGSISFGDAGVVAFQSGLVSLDNIGLGSELVAHNGVSEGVIDAYAPDLIIFHSRADRVRLEVYGQDVLLRWSEARGYRFLCEMVFGPDYTLRLYGRSESEALSRVCDSSRQKNGVSNAQLIRTHIVLPPWRFWHE